METVIEIEKVDYSVKAKSILRQNSLCVKAKEFCVVVGPNGGGKTTLLKILLGMLKPSAGRVRVFGQSPEKIRGAIGYMPQLTSFDNDFPILVSEAVLMGCLADNGVLKRFSAADYEKARLALKSVGLADYWSKPIGVLSGGERQRVFFARALVNDPELLLLDEPTASIDPKVRNDIFELLFALRGKKTVLMVTHDLSIVGHQFDRLACLNRDLHVHESVDALDALESMYDCPVSDLRRAIHQRKKDGDAKC